LTDFYLVTYHQEEINATTKIHNILYSSEAFQVNTAEPIDKIELWNYNIGKKMGTFYIKGAFASKNYHFEFKRSNLMINIATSYLTEPQRVRKSCDRKASDQTDAESFCFGEVQGRLSDS
jgi:hypothetical protein